ncbi:mast cell protease 1A-like [Thunnus maccoyii]|uniref:mast cell protease 1A-like n=1 Tax=Thunnus maccoyii TaxID=8240 RepID=UPI001C4B9BBF|nr:mast cell protease 1A-like [Thunnus maccoyii]
MMHGLHKFLLFHVLTCLRQNGLGSEIINGKKAKKSLLYMASVQVNRSHKCGGFLISEDFVVTAAHCDSPHPMSVVLGTNNLRKVVDDTMRYNVMKYKHPDYVDILSGNDIMLLKLSRKAHLGKKPIKPIKLPSHHMNLKGIKKCSVAGWGFTRTGGQIVDELREVNVSIIKLKVCKDKWLPGVKFPHNIICAGGYGTDKGFCQGDSGGPLVCNGIAVGVVSFNNGGNCDYPDVPNIYTDISKFIPWINVFLKKNNS